MSVQKSARRDRKSSCYRCFERGVFAWECLMKQSSLHAFQSVHEEDPHTSNMGITHNHGMSPLQPFIQTYVDRTIVNGDYLVEGSNKGTWNSFGGREEITKKNEWSEMAMSFGYPECYRQAFNELFHQYLLIPQEHCKFGLKRFGRISSIDEQDVGSRPRERGPRGGSPWRGPRGRAPGWGRAHNPGLIHWQAMNRVFKYLKGTMDYGLTYSGFPSVLEGYSDASWITNTEDHSSTSGWIFLLGGGAICWASKKQTCITASTMESEFVALAAAGKEAEWLRNLIYEIPLGNRQISSISIRCDSQATLARAYSEVYNGKSRHLGVRHSMIRDYITNGVISVVFVKTQHNLAYHLTKGLNRDLVKSSAIGVGLKSTRNL
ncbi:hypothetical protein OSB04_003161 [Centaurea solstitialis]|uniref:Zinc finger, CCHC-type n=1 Tax=Centaurea solstitialis TaxID=347529 RepID=A0AA38TUB6_9ASTR|nr:hypothetical protein OSB04_003161 [Centaurea solstitialis]